MAVERPQSRALSAVEAVAVIALLVLSVVPAGWRDKPSLAWHAAGTGFGTAIGVFMSIRFGARDSMVRALQWAAGGGLVAAALVGGWQVLRGQM